MADVFISYSRKDQDFVRRLHEALAGQGRDTWVDWEGIPPTAEWMKEIHTAIEAADTFVFVISPDSVASEVCKLEVEHAVELDLELRLSRNLSQSEIEKGGKAAAKVQSTKGGYFAMDQMYSANENRMSNAWSFHHLLSLSQRIRKSAGLAKILSEH